MPACGSPALIASRRFPKMTRRYAPPSCRISSAPCVCIRSWKMVDSERRLYAGTVDRMLVGTVMLDETGAVLKSNPVADEMICEGDGLRQVNGVLRADAAAENRELQRLVKQALNGDGGKPAVVNAISITSQICSRQARSAGAKHARMRDGRRASAVRRSRFSFATPRGNPKPPARWCADCSI